MIRVRDNRRYLAAADGKPFFCLADTAWELFHRLTRTEIGHFEPPEPGDWVLDAADEHVHAPGHVSDHNGVRWTSRRPRN